MPSLKDLRNRIRSVQSTKKITSAMKVVAASRLKKAQDAAVAARPYAERMERMLASLSASMAGRPGLPLLSGTGREQTHLLIVATSDRGLAGGFNATILREARRQMRALEAAGNTVKIITIGRKGRDALRRDHGKQILESFTDIGRRGVAYDEARAVAEAVVNRFLKGEFDVATLVFNTFKSAISQIVTSRRLIPFGAAPAEAKPSESGKHSETGQPAQAPISYEFEPDEEEILAELLPTNLAVQIFTALLENTASEHGARMTAMDNATRNAGKMIERLTLNYNRTRQAFITKELIEIISGAEAL
jgi:F-type H+-transporting ATPase subunit gamma